MIGEWRNCTLPDTVRLTKDKQTWRKAVHVITGLATSIKTKICDL